MADEFVDMLRPGVFTPEGFAPGGYLIASNDIRGLPCPKLATVAYNAISRIPGSLTVGTGLTFTVYVSDDGSTASDLGLVVRYGITVKRIVSGTDTLDLDTGAATEATTDITLAATTGIVKTGSIAIANAALDSVVTGNHFAVRVRRIGTHANDTAA